MSPAKTKEMTIYAQRAFLGDDYPLTLEQVLLHICENSNSLEAKSVLFDDLFAKAHLLDYKTTPSNFGIGVSLATFEEGRSVSTIKFDQSDDKADLGEVTAGSDAEFLDQNIAIFVEGNQLITCGLGNRSAALCNAIKRLADKCGLSPELPFFNIANAPNNQSISDIRRIGVEAVDLNVTNYIGSFDAILKTNAVGMFLSKPKNIDVDNRRKQHRAKLSIKSRKISAESIIEDDWLTDIAVSSIEDESISSYNIKLKNGNSISSTAMILSTTITLVKTGTSYHFLEAHGKMEAYYKQLCDGKELE